MTQKEYMEDLIVFGREVAEMRRIEEKERRDFQKAQIKKKHEKEQRRRLRQSKMF